MEELRLVRCAATRKPNGRPKPDTNIESSRPNLPDEMPEKGKALEIGKGRIVQEGRKDAKTKVGPRRTSRLAFACASYK